MKPAALINGLFFRKARRPSDSVVVFFVEVKNKDVAGGRSGGLGDRDASTKASASNI
jgi:hypothetical protein